MPLQASGTISMANLQTEFGGANPISLSQYYRGGGRVPNIAANNNVPTAGTISLSQFYNATVVAPGGVINPLAINGQNYAYSSGSNSSQVSITFLTNGTWSVDYLPFTGQVAAGNWWSAGNTPGIGNSYWIRFVRNTLNANSAGSATATTGWQQLSTNRILSVGAASPVVSGFAIATYTIQIASDGSGTNIVSTSNVTLEAYSSAGADL